MSPAPVRPRARARQDVDDAVRHYLRDAGPDVALRFIDALQAAYRVIAANPAAGSPRYGHELALPGLRSVRLKRYPYLVFYIVHDGSIDVWRVLHAQRHIPAGLQNPQR